MYYLLFFITFFSFCHADLHEMQQIPKKELHIHIGGAWPLAYLHKIAAPQDYDQLLHYLTEIEKSLDYHAAFHIFGVIYKIVNTDQKIEEGTYALCEELLKDNVHYVELRTGLKDLGNGLESYLQAVLRGMHRSSLHSKLLLSLRRDTPLSVAQKTIELALQYRDQGIIGIDVSGDSTKGDGEEIIGALLQAKNAGLPILLHLGESAKELPHQQMTELLTLKPARIGHGVHLCPQAQQYMLDNRIPLELCLTSALKCQMIQTPLDHPGLLLLKNGHPVAICTDDPLIFNTTLSQEFEQVATLLNMTPQEIEASQKLL